MRVLFEYEWHPCWLCNGTINGDAPAGLEVRIERPGLPVFDRHVHRGCLAIHNGVDHERYANLATITSVCVS